VAAPAPTIEANTLGIIMNDAPDTSTEAPVEINVLLLIVCIDGIGSPFVA
jgi:hypothetical protein